GHRPPPCRAAAASRARRRRGRATAGTARRSPARSRPAHQDGVAARLQLAEPEDLGIPRGICELRRESVRRRDGAGEAHAHPGCGSAFGEQCRVRVVCEGRFELPLPPAEALPFFTPEGERAWAGPAWNPVYPDPGAAVDDSAPGTVFTTESHGGDA